MKRLGLVLVVCGFLPGCAGGIAAGSVAAGSMVPTIATAIGVGTKTLSEVAKASCAAQQAANVASDVAKQSGNVAWMQKFSQISQVAGIGCSW